MLRIGLTQRQEPIPGRDETRDALDQRWAELLWSLGYLPIPLCSSLHGVSDAYLDALALDGILLTGGNDLGSAPARDQLETQLLHWAARHQRPVLGVCRGMQKINHFCGGQLTTLSGHVACRHPLEGDWAKYWGLSEVNSYHNQVILPATLGQNLRVLATSPDQVIEAFEHQHWPWLGVMWHPERDPLHPSQDEGWLNRFFRRTPCV